MPLHVVYGVDSSSQRNQGFYRVWCVRMAEKWDRSMPGRLNWRISWDPRGSSLEYRNGIMVLTRKDFAAVTCSCVACVPATAPRSRPETGNSLVAPQFLSKSLSRFGVSGTSGLSSVSRHLHDWPTSCIGCLIDGIPKFAFAHLRYSRKLRPRLDPFSACVLVEMSQARVKTMAIPFGRTRQVHGEAAVTLREWDGGE